MLLARVTPALFPGQQLPLAAIDFPRALDPLRIQPLRIEAPGPSSVFNQPIVVLVVGLDARPGDPVLATVNTDTIMLLRVDPVGKNARALSVPRDLLIETDTDDGSTSFDRVNISFAVASAQGGFDAGMEGLRRDLERALDISIDYWVGLDFAGAERLINGMGGVDLEIPEDLAIAEWWYSDDDVHHQLLSFPAGFHHLDGYHAVAFARLRALDDDLHRIKRQQLLVQAAFTQAFSTGLMRDPLGFWSSYRSSLHTNVPVSKMPGLALLSKQLQSSIEVFSLAEPVNGAAAVLDETLPSGAAVLVGVPEAMRYWIERVFGVPEQVASLKEKQQPAGTAGTP